MSRNRILRMLGMLLALTLFVAACGDDDDSDTASEDTTADDISEATTEDTTEDTEAPADQTANATVHLVDAVMLPPSAQ